MIRCRKNRAKFLFLGLHSLMAGLRILFQFFGNGLVPFFESLVPVFFHLHYSFKKTQLFKKDFRHFSIGIIFKRNFRHSLHGSAWPCSVLLGSAWPCSVLGLTQASPGPYPGLTRASLGPHPGLMRASPGPHEGLTRASPGPHPGTQVNTG